MDGTTSATFSNNIDDLTADLQKEFENAIDWFCSNEMVVNLDKFQSIIINRLGKFKNSYKLLIENHKVYSKNFVTLLGIEIDNKLNFGKHLTTVYQKAGRHLNTLSGKHKYNEFQEQKMLLDCFIFSNLIYCPFAWHFSSAAFFTENRESKGTGFEVIV